MSFAPCAGWLSRQHPQGKRHWLTHAACVVHCRILRAGLTHVAEHYSCIRGKSVTYSSHATAGPAKQCMRRFICCILTLSNSTFLQPKYQFDLHAALMSIRLSCRVNVNSTFRPSCPNFQSHTASAGIADSTVRAHGRTYRG